MSNVPTGLLFLGAIHRKWRRRWLPFRLSKEEVELCQNETHCYVRLLYRDCHRGVGHLPN